MFGGIETGGTWTVCAIGTGPDDVRDEVEFRTTTPDETVERIVEFLTAGRDQPPIAVGLGAFGPLDLDPGSDTFGHVTTTPKPRWQGAPIAPALRGRLNLPLAVDTDVNAAAMAEARWGAGRDAGTLCYLTVGTGIGGGIVSGGRPWHGLSHPEVGHLRVPHHPGDDFGGNCPLHGDCWEGLAAGGAIAERWGAGAEDLGPEHPAWEIEAFYLAAGILAIVSVAAPHRVILGGGVAQASGLLERTVSELERLNAGYLPLPDVVAPDLGDRAGVLGALILAETAVRRGLSDEVVTGEDVHERDERDD